MNVPMLYVNPVTGPFAGRRWLCYVCQYGSAPVLAVFLKPDDAVAARNVEAAQRLSDQNPQLRVFVVYLSGPDPVLEEKIRALAKAHKYTVPLTVLPEQGAVGSIYEVLPISPNSPATAILYRGRQMAEKPLDNLRFDDAVGAPSPPTNPAQPEALFANLDFSNRPQALVMNDLLGGNPGTPARAAMSASADFQKMAGAVAKLLQ